MQDLLTKFANLTIQSDFIFKKVMSRKRICKHLLEELLQIEIADINYIEAKKLSILTTQATVSAWISSWQTIRIRIIIWRCR